MKNKKAQLSIYFAFIVLGFLIVLIGGVFAPMGADISTRFYMAGEDILATTARDVGGIDDVGVRASVNASLYEAMSATETNIDVTTDLFQYSWVMVLALTGIVLFLLTRRLVESQGGII
jgi:hypothetical protein